jgi:hypothetical protein
VRIRGYCRALAPRRRGSSSFRQSARPMANASNCRAVTLLVPEQSPRRRPVGIGKELQTLRTPSQACSTTTPRGPLVRRTARRSAECRRIGVGPCRCRPEGHRLDLQLSRCGLGPAYHGQGFRGVGFALQVPVPAGCRPVSPTARRPPRPPRRRAARRRTTCCCCRGSILPAARRRHGAAQLLGGAGDDGQGVGG